MGLLALYMAPLQGLTEAPFRNSFERNFGGVDAYFTPFVRQEHGGPRRKDLRGLEPDANAVNLSGKTAMDYAVERDNTPLVKLLLPYME